MPEIIDLSQEEDEEEDHHHRHHQDYDDVVVGAELRCDVVDLVDSDVEEGDLGRFRELSERLFAPSGNNNKDKKKPKPVNQPQQPPVAQTNTVPVHHEASSEKQKRTSNKQDGKDQTTRSVDRPELSAVNHSTKKKKKKNKKKNILESGSYRAASGNLVFMSWERKLKEELQRTKTPAKNLLHMWFSRLPVPNGGVSITKDSYITWCDRSGRSSWPCRHFSLFVDPRTGQCFPSIGRPGVRADSVRVTPECTWFRGPALAEQGAAFCALQWFLSSSSFSSSSSTEGPEKHVSSVFDYFHPFLPDKNFDPPMGMTPEALDKLLATVHKAKSSRCEAPSSRVAARPHGLGRHLDPRLRAKNPPPSIMMASNRPVQEPWTGKQDLPHEPRKLRSNAPREPRPKDPPKDPEQLQTMAHRRSDPRLSSTPLVQERAKSKCPPSIRDYTSLGENPWTRNQASAGPLSGKKDWQHEPRTLRSSAPLEPAPVDPPKDPEQVQTMAHRRSDPRLSSTPMVQERTRLEYTKGPPSNRDYTSVGENPWTGNNARAEPLSGKKDWQHESRTLHSNTPLEPGPNDPPKDPEQVQAMAHRRSDPRLSSTPMVQERTKLECTKSPPSNRDYTSLGENPWTGNKATAEPSLRPEAPPPVMTNSTFDETRRRDASRSAQTLPETLTTSTTEIKDEAGAERTLRPGVTASMFVSTFQENGAMENIRSVPTMSPPPVTKSGAHDEDGNTEDPFCLRPSQFPFCVRDRPEQMSHCKDPLPTPNGNSVIDDNGSAGIYNQEPSPITVPSSNEKQFEAIGVKSDQDEHGSVPSSSTAVKEEDQQENSCFETTLHDKTLPPTPVPSIYQKMENGMTDAKLQEKASTLLADLPAVNQNSSRSNSESNTRFHRASPRTKEHSNVRNRTALGSPKLEVDLYQQLPPQQKESTDVIVDSERSQAQFDRETRSQMHEHDGVQDNSSKNDSGRSIEKPPCKALSLAQNLSTVEGSVTVDSRESETQFLSKASASRLDHSSVTRDSSRSDESLQVKLPSPSQEHSAIHDEFTMESGKSHQNKSLSLSQDHSAFHDKFTMTSGKSHHMTLSQSYGHSAVHDKLTLESGKSESTSILHPLTPPRTQEQSTVHDSSELYSMASPTIQQYSTDHGNMTVENGKSEANLQRKTLPETQEHPAVHDNLTMDSESFEAKLPCKSSSPTPKHSTVHNAVTMESGEAEATLQRTASPLTQHLHLTHSNLTVETGKAEEILQRKSPTVNGNGPRNNGMLRERLRSETPLTAKKPEANVLDKTHRAVNKVHRKTPLPLLVSFVVKGKLTWGNKRMDGTCRPQDSLSMSPKEDMHSDLSQVTHAFSDAEDDPFPSTFGQSVLHGKDGCDQLQSSKMRKLYALDQGVGLSSYVHSREAIDPFGRNPPSRLGMNVGQNFSQYQIRKVSITTATSWSANRHRLDIPHSTTDSANILADAISHGLSDQVQCAFSLATDEKSTDHAVVAETTRQLPFSASMHAPMDDKVKEEKRKAASIPYMLASGPTNNDKPTPMGRNVVVIDDEDGPFARKRKRVGESEYSANKKFFKNPSPTTINERAKEPIHVAASSTSVEMSATKECRPTNTNPPVHKPKPRKVVKENKSRQANKKATDNPTIGDKKAKPAPRECNFILIDDEDEAMIRKRKRVQARKEFTMYKKLPPKNPFSEKRDFSYCLSADKAQEIQERLFRESAARVKVQALMDRARFQSEEEPIFESTMANVEERYPLHWKWKDPYSRLGLCANAPMYQVKIQYRRFARLYHPDKSNAPNTSERFQQVASAYHKIKQDKSR